MATFEEQQLQNLKKFVLNNPNDTGAANRLNAWNQTGKDQGTKNLVTLVSNKPATVTKPTTMSQPQQQASPYEDIFKNYWGTITNTGSNASSLAQSQASRQANQQRSAINSALQGAQSSYDQGLRQVDTAMADAKQNQEETAFQKYLASRQQIANSGLSGSGLAKDEDVRLQLANQRNIAGIERDAANQRYALQENYNNRANELNNQLQGIDEGAMYNELFSQYNAQEMQNRATQAQMLGNYFGMLQSADQDQYNREQNAKQFAMQESGITGMYNGKQTYERQQAEQQAQAAAQQQRIDGLWKAADQTGYIPNELADIYGIKRGLTTLQAQQMLLGQQQWQSEFDANNQYRNAQLGLDQQRLNNDMYQFNQSLNNDNYWKEKNFGLSEQELNAKLNQPSSPLSASQLSGYMDMLNKKYLVYNEDSKKYSMPKTKENKQKAQDNIYKSILSLGLPDNQTMTLLQQYGLQDRVNFNTTSKGDGRYNNLYKTKEASKSKTFIQFQSDLSQAIKKTGVPANWSPYLTELIGRESSWNPSAKNQTSTAHGYAQFLNSTRASYEKKYGIKYDSPVNQLILGIMYVKNRYGDPVKALKFWDKNNWY